MRRSQRGPVSRPGMLVLVNITAVIRSWPGQPSRRTPAAPSCRRGGLTATSRAGMYTPVEHTDPARGWLPRSPGSTCVRPTGLLHKRVQVLSPTQPHQYGSLPSDCFEITAPTQHPAIQHPIRIAEFVPATIAKLFRHGQNASTSASTSSTLVSVGNGIRARVQSCPGVSRPFGPFTSAGR